MKYRLAAVIFIILMKIAFCALFGTLTYFGCTWLGLEETTSLIIAVITGIVCFLL